MHLGELDMVIACGFCVPGPTAYILPIVPTWCAVFVLWCLFRLKYDPRAKSESALWLFMAFVMLVCGAIASIALWSFFLAFWTWRLVVARDVCAREARVADKSGDEGKLAVMLLAAEFHKHTLILLMAGLGMSTIRNFQTLFHRE